MACQCFFIEPKTFCSGITTFEYQIKATKEIPLERGGDLNQVFSPFAFSLDVINALVSVKGWVLAMLDLSRSARGTVKRGREYKLSLEGKTKRVTFRSFQESQPKTKNRMLK